MTPNTTTADGPTPSRLQLQSERAQLGPTAQRIPSDTPFTQQPPLLLCPPQPNRRGKLAAEKAEASKLICKGGDTKGGSLKIDMQKAAEQTAEEAPEKTANRRQRGGKTDLPTMESRCLHAGQGRTLPGLANHGQQACVLSVLMRGVGALT